MKKKLRYTNVDQNDIARLKHIKPHCQGLWLVIKYHAGSNNKCWASRARLAEMLGQSERKISRGIVQLVDDNIITVDKRPGQTTVIRLVKTLDTGVPTTLDTSGKRTLDTNVPNPRHERPDTLDTDVHRLIRKKTNNKINKRKKERSYFYIKEIFDFWSQDAVPQNTRWVGSFDDWYHAQWTDADEALGVALLQRECESMQQWLKSKGGKWGGKYWQTAVLRWLRGKKVPTPEENTAKFETADDLYVPVDGDSDELKAIKSWMSQHHHSVGLPQELIERIKKEFGTVEMRWLRGVRPNIWCSLTLEGYGKDKGIGEW